MYSGQSLRTFLEENCVNAKFMRFDYKSNEKFNIELKCQVEKDQTPEFYSKYATSWVKKFSKYTATTWIVRQCFPRLKRLLYRKIYHCHRSSFNKKKKLDYDSRNQECRAKIEFRMKFINRNTIKNDPLLKEGLNLTISIDFNHSHKVRTLEAFNMLKSTTDTDELFMGYFDNGCNPAAAKFYHELTLIDKHGEDCLEILSNATINPSQRHLFYLHAKRRKERLRTPSIQEIIEMKRSVLEPSGVTISYQEPLVVIITPMMKRVIAEISLEYVLIDSSTVTGGPICTFFYVPTKVGAIPFACTIDTDFGNDRFSNAFFSVKLGVESLTGVKFEPEIIMLSHFKKQKCLSHLVPNAKLMSSRYSICSEVWSWLNDDDNKIERKKRHNLMFTIKSFLYSSETAEKVYSELQGNETISMKLKEYLESIWETREDWFFSKDHIIANPLVEASIRFMKEFIKQKCKNFNSCILVDTLTNVLENHHRRILHSFINKKDTISTYTRYLSKAKIVLGFGSDVRRISTNEFRIDLRQKPKKYLYFRTDTMFCDCLDGKKGNFCEHLSAIINIIDTDVMKNSVLTEEEVSCLTKIAGSEIKEDIKIIKPEIDEDIELYESNNDQDEIYQNEMENLDERSTTSDGNDDYCFEVKTEKNRCDPLEEDSDQDYSDNPQIIENNDIPTTSNHTPDIRKTYEVALKAVNDEFRRLNKFFSENPNTSNLETMRRLTKELSKIRPVERVNLDNMYIELNETRKKQREC